MSDDKSQAGGAVAAANTDYDASKIKVLKGLEAVRKRPGMYIGDTASYGLHHLVREIVDNSVDEHLARDAEHPAGYCQNIHVIVHRDNSVTVSDDGRGIPVDMHATEKKPALEVALTVLHAGGKFDNDAYKVSGGLHGVGLSVVNALSEVLNVEVHVKGQHYKQRYERGDKASELQKAGATTKHGTTVHFKPDAEIFQDLDFKYDILSKRMRDLAYLNAGLTLRIDDERSGKTDTYCYKGGIREFVKYLNANKELIHKDIIYIHSVDEQGNTDTEVAFQYNDGYNENLLSYANNINTPDGGTHLVGFRTALTRAINNFAKKNNLLKPNDEPPTGEDLREGLSAVVSVKLRDPQFEGQTKTKLGNADTGKKVESLVYDKLSTMAEEHPGTFKAIFNKGLLAQEARIAAKKAKELTRRKSALSSGSLPGKLADCSSNDKEESELYVVEGDSAGGSAKGGRDRRFQAILPLKGKILNVEKARLDKMLSHTEIQTLIQAIGTGIGAEEFDMEKLRYGKIIIMTDADVDGSHIRTLLLTFFFRHMPKLVTENRIYIAQPPLYKVTRKGRFEYVHSDKEMRHTLSRLGMESCELSLVDSDTELKGDELRRIVELLEALEDFGPAIRRHGIHFERYLKLRNPAGKLPILRALREKQETLFYSEDEFQVWRETMERELGQAPQVWESGDDASRMEKADVRLYRISEAAELEPRLAELARLGFDPATYGSDLIDRYELKYDDRVKVVSGLEDVLAAIRAEGQQGIEVQRYKGLGEMNPEQLWETTMDPKRRTLLRVRLSDDADADWIFNVLMGTMVEPRKEYITKHALEVRNLDLV